MPVIGFISPSHKEKRNDGVDNLPSWLTAQALYEESLRSDPRWSPWSPELLKASIETLQNRGSRITTTSLTSPCPRSVVLERMVDYVGNIDDLWRAFRGTMVHAVLERAARAEGIAEHRFFCPFDGTDEISCSPDLVTLDTIYDYKNTAKNPAYDYPYRGHTEQLQLNRYIVNRATKVMRDDEVVNKFPFDYREVEFKHLVVVYLDLDGPKQLETLRTEKVEGRRGRRVPSIWSDEAVEATFLERFQTLRVALDAYPDFPEGVASTPWWGPGETYACPGYPHCPLKGKCLASRWPNGFVW